MKLKLFVGKTNPDFQIKGYEKKDSGEEVPIAGEGVFLVELEPILLTKAEYQEVLRKSRNHELEVTL